MAAKKSPDDSHSYEKPSETVPFVSPPPYEVIKHDCNILLVSKTGGGKSSLGNALLELNNRDPSAFRVGDGGLRSRTVNSMDIKRVINGRRYTVVDTPGTMDRRNPEMALEEISRAIALCPDGFHVILLVIRIDCRFTDEEKMAVKLLIMMFGENLYRFCIIVFSHGDQIQNDEYTFREQIDEARGDSDFLNHLLSNCGNRIALVDNGPSRQPEVHTAQLNKLRAEMDQLVRRNGDDNVYSNAYFELAKEIQEKAKRQQQEMERQEREEFQRRRDEEQASLEAKFKIKMEEEYRRRLEEKLAHLEAHDERMRPTEREHQEAEFKQQLAEVRAEEEAEFQRKQQEEEKRRQAEENKRIEEQRQQNEENAIKAAADALWNRFKEYNNSCFPADATVQTPDGPVRMSELRLGQLVLAQEPDGRLAYSPVYTWGHRDPHASPSAWMVVHTASGASLTLSSDHLLPLATDDSRGVAASAAARRLRAGASAVWTLEDGGRRMRRDLVTEVRALPGGERPHRVGLFAPFTLCGNLVVDGVLASCYVDCRLPAPLLHVLLWPVRSAWRVWPAAVEAAGCPDAADGMPGWVRFAVKRLLPGLQRLVPMLE